MIGENLADIVIDFQICHRVGASALSHRILVHIFNTGNFGKVSAKGTECSRRLLAISSVSCLYGIGNPADFHANTITVKVGDAIARNSFLYKLVDSMYSRSDVEFKRGTFRVNGDSVDIYLAYGEEGARIVFFGNTVEEIEIFDPVSGTTKEYRDEISIYPANIFSTTKERMALAVKQIQDDLVLRYGYFMDIGKNHEANRLKQRVEYDLEMIKELGWCPGIENYSRYFDGRPAGTRPFCLLDYFPKDYITFIDESHVTLPQVRSCGHPCSASASGPAP